MTHTPTHTHSPNVSMVAHQFVVLKSWC